MADILGTTIVSKDNDANAVANPIYVNISDGTDSIAVNADGSLNATVSATNLDIRDLVFATDKVDVSGSSVSITGSVTVTATDLDIRDLVFATDKVDVSGSTLGANSGVDIGDVTINNGSGANAVNIQDGGNSITVDGTVAVSSISGSVTVTATDLDIRDLTLAQDAVKISANSTANSVSNPIFVALGTGTITGEIHNYSQASSIANAGTSDHTYTAVATFLCKSVVVSASGKARFEVKAGATGSPTTKNVSFTSPGGQTNQIMFDPPIEVVAGDVLRITRTNLDRTQDMYSTIIGIDA